MNINKNKVIRFHNPDEENGYLSNWYISTFSVGGVPFTSMEQYMMFEKARVFKDFKILYEMLKTNDVAVIKKLGRQISGYNDVIWNGIRQNIVFRGAYQKFSCNEDIKKKLLGTGDAILAECAVNDKIWGIGLGMDDLKALSIDMWKGQNLLGFTLMSVRDVLMQEKGDRA